MHGYQTRRICILVKAYPQHSQKYEETVCCAGITDDARLLRLYPIRYRRLPEDSRFERFDWVEMQIARAGEDPRPESFKVADGSIRIIKRASKLNLQERVRLWKPFVAPSLSDLEDQGRSLQRSLGIVRPDPDSVSFVVKKGDDDEQMTRLVYQQSSLLDPNPLKPLRPPPYSFKYRFTSSGKRHEMQLHDWEVGATRAF